MFCLRNQDITDAKAFFYLFFMSNSGYIVRPMDMLRETLQEYENWILDCVRDGVN